MPDGQSPTTEAAPSLLSRLSKDDLLQVKTELRYLQEHERGAISKEEGRGAGEVPLGKVVPEKVRLTLNLDHATEVAFQKVAEQAGITSSSTDDKAQQLALNRAIQALDSRFRAEVDQHHGLPSSGEMSLPRAREIADSELGGVRGLVRDANEQAQAVKAELVQHAKEAVGIDDSQTKPLGTPSTAKDKSAAPNRPSK